MAVCAAIAPYEDARSVARRLVEEHGKFVEIFLINAPILLPITPWAPFSQVPFPSLKEEHECGPQGPWTQIC